MLKSLFYNSTIGVVRAIKFLFNANIKVKNLDNISRSDVSYVIVANHFTRIETLLLANLIYKKNNIKVRALADHSIFTKSLKEYFENIGLVDTKDPNRNQIILNDLFCGKNNWLIFPEGKMIKNKKPTYIHSGAYLLAIQAYLLQEEYKKIKHNDEKLQKFIQKNNLKEDFTFLDKEIHIAPVSINYYFLRSDSNNITDTFRNIFDIKSSRVNEEIDIESNILLNSEIIINILKPIPIKEYLKKYKTKNDILNKARMNLSSEVMNSIYENISIHMEHIVALVLWLYPKEEICIDEFKRIVFYICTLLSKTNKVLHYSICKNIISLVSDEENEALEKVLLLAKSSKVIKIDKTTITILKDNYNKDYHFHSIRVKNTLKVILNEILTIKEVVNLSKKAIKITSLKQNIAKYLINYDKDLYELEIQEAEDISTTKTANAKARLLRGSKNVGIVLSHGFSSSPNEVYYLARKLNNMGYFVYMNRVKAHSITPKYLSLSTYEQWSDSYNIGYAILSQMCEHIVLGGFSMGGLLAMYSESKKVYKNKILGIVAIAPALKLKDIRINEQLLDTAVFVSDLISELNSKALSIDYVDNTPEYPDFNYNKIYISSLRQLSLLEGECKKVLPKITSPILVIINSDDPIVSKKSAKIIMDNVSSEKIMIYSLRHKKHIIINNSKKLEVFEVVNSFIGGLI